MRAWGDDAIVGSFEELPVILVVLVAVSLFSVSLAHAATSWGEDDDYYRLQQDCQAFSGMVRDSEILCVEGRTGIYDHNRLANASQADFFDEFNSTLLGFEYHVQIQCIDLETGNISLDVDIRTSENPKDADVASYHSCVNVENGGRMGAARVIVSIWCPHG